MAIYHCDLKNVKRGKGASSVAKAAYISRSRLRDDRTDNLYNYSRRKDLGFSEIITPENTPKWTKNRQELWSINELSNKRKDARVAKEILVALPKELDTNEQLHLVRKFVAQNVTCLGAIADVNAHELDFYSLPESDQENWNPHCHILINTQHLNDEGDGFGRKIIELNDKNFLLKLRKSWANLANEALEAAGSNARIDHRSLKEQGINRIPQIHLGPQVAQMMAKDIRTDRGDRYLEIEAQNRRLKRQEAFAKTVPAIVVEPEPEIAIAEPEPEIAIAIAQPDPEPQVTIAQSEPQPEIAIAEPEPKAEPQMVSGLEVAKKAMEGTGIDISRFISTPPEPPQPEPEPRLRDLLGRVVNKGKNALFKSWGRFKPKKKTKGSFHRSAAPYHADNGFIDRIFSYKAKFSYLNYIYPRSGINIEFSFSSGELLIKDNSRVHLGTTRNLLQAVWTGNQWQVIANSMNKSAQTKLIQNIEGQLQQKKSERQETERKRKVMKQRREEMLRNRVVQPQKWQPPPPREIPETQRWQAPQEDWIPEYENGIKGDRDRESDEYEL